MVRDEHQKLKSCVKYNLNLGIQEVLLSKVTKHMVQCCRVKTIILLFM